MPLNKLENFVKNTEGRILYVNPNDIDATDDIDNQGNSLSKPFRTIQRALLESARFSYVRGGNNDSVEKTTILLFPGEHVIDNRPGFAIKDVNGTAIAVSPSGEQTPAQETLTLNLSSNFDLTQNNNILYRFNSIYGGVVVPRGTSIVGLDLRKTKIRAKYIPNPTDSTVKSSAIFRITGACYFWQFSFFDGDDSGLVYTDPIDFSVNNQSRPTFSHHKLTCFEYCDGVNIPSGYALTDLDMYYGKLSNAFNAASGRDIDQKFPTEPLGFSKQRPEYEIVGAFASDPLNISAVFSGDGFTPGTVVTVSTSSPHNLTAGTPIKIDGIDPLDYNISTKVQSVISATEFTYLLPFVRVNLPATPLVSGSTVTVETDTVSGASPYIFNCSLRSVWGMQGMHADGSKAAGFRSMVVAQFTGISLQKDDRAFVRYNSTSRAYESLTITTQKGAELSSGSSSTNPATVYHLDSDSIYRPGWETSHIKMSNDAFVQIVSVFAIGYNKHFDVLSGGDGSITNSNSNFGQISLNAEGFKKEAFSKDNHGYITSVIRPKAITNSEFNVDWTSINVGLTSAVGISSHLYLFGYTDIDAEPPIILQGYRVGAKQDDVLYLDTSTGVKQATICMSDNNVAVGATVVFGTTTNRKIYYVTGDPTNNILLIGNVTNPHKLKTGESIRIFSDNGDLPQNIVENTLYYAIKVDDYSIKIASSKTNADNGTALTIYGGKFLRVESRVNDKLSGDIGSPVQFDSINKNWFIHVSPTNNTIYSEIATQGVAGLTERTDIAYIKRIDDSRSLDEKLYKVRYVIPKEVVNARSPVDGYVLQESSSTGARRNTDFSIAAIGQDDYGYNRNPRFISTCTVATNTITVVCQLPHNLNVGDIVNIKNVASTTNPAATPNLGFNGTFAVSAIVDDLQFQYTTTDVLGVVHGVGSFNSNINSRTITLPRFERNDLKSNLYIYRSEVIKEYIEDVQDGIYHLYILNASNAIETEFTDLKYSQNLTDLYPQSDKDNINDNPQSTKTYAKRSPLGDVVTNDISKSLTRETIDKVLKDFGVGLKIVGVTTFYTTATAGVATITFDRAHGYGGISTYSTLIPGSGYTNSGTYHDVKLYNTTTLNWDGATAKVVVSGGSVTSATITNGGSQYTNGETLDFDSTALGGGGSGARITIATAGINTNIGDVLNVTGIGTTSDGYYRITNVPSKTTITVPITSSDPKIISGQYAVNVGPAVNVNSNVYDSSSGISTFTCAFSHGLVVGEKFRLVSATNANLGEFIVRERVGINTFNAITNASLSPAYLFHLGLVPGSSTSDSSAENLGSRGLSFYAGDDLILQAGVTTSSILRVRAKSSGIGTLTRFPLGSYIQSGNEIMRITSSTLTGSGLDEISVIRGSLGTPVESHSTGQIIRKIKPIPVESRRASIIRASGHTFEYLGYGPGNYSTGLPQVQVKTLNEREEFLVQAQERSCGNVAYTGMNGNGDFFVGNTKYISSSGTQKTFDIPIPTVAGQDSSRLSVVFDEIVAKERIIVEGGASGTVLSQFDGPVSFNKELKFNSNTTTNGVHKVTGLSQYTNATEATGVTATDTASVIFTGGVAIKKKLYIGGDLRIESNSDLYLKDNGVINLGDSNDLQIYHNGTDSIIQDTGTGSLYVQGTGGVYIRNAAGTETLAAFTADGNVELYHDNSKKLETQSGGIAITGALTVSGDITAFFTSDQRLKDNIVPISNSLEKVNALSGNTYTWNEKSGKEGQDVGVIAQEVQAVLPEAVVERDNGYLAVDYHKLVPLLVESIKDLTIKVEKLEQKLSDK
jgi:hypothetical protein